MGLIFQSRMGSSLGEDVVQEVLFFLGTSDADLIIP